MTQHQERLVLRLWRDWCRLWPKYYGPSSLNVRPEGYDPVFDLIPSQAYKDFYLEVTSDHPALRHLDMFEVADIALNQSHAPEVVLKAAEQPASPLRASEHARITEVDVEVTLEESAELVASTGSASLEGELSQQAESA